MSVVISLGGSTIIGDSGVDIEFLRGFAKTISQYEGRVGIVVGGGAPARLYANAARELGAGEYEADMIAIRATRQNAHLLMIALQQLGVDVHAEVLIDFEEAKTANRKIVVMGGTIPGISTDTDAVLLAEAMRAKKLLNVSKVEALYNKDPKEPDAKKLESISYEKLEDLAYNSDKRKAGTNFLFDLVACRLAARSNIEIHFVGKNENEIKKALLGEKHNGTVVKGDGKD